MLKTFCKKITRLSVTILIVTALAFFIVNLLPGDAAHTVAGLGATSEDVQAIRENLGLHEHIFLRYAKWLFHASQGDFGHSFRSGEPVVDIFKQRLPVTMELVIISQVMVLILAVPMGIISAWNSETNIGKIITAFTFGVMSVPVFVMALVLMLVFSLNLSWLPATGYVSLANGILANFQSLVLPGLSIAIVECVPLMRVLRSDMISTLQQDFILMARAKGLPMHTILIKHALRPSCLSFITIFGIQIGYIIGGAVVIENIFSLPGLGSLLISAIHGREINIVLGCILLVTVSYVLINFIVDILYSVLDPRINFHDDLGVNRV